MKRYYKFINKKTQPVDRLQDADWIHITAPLKPEEIESFARDLDVPMDFIADPLDVNERSRYEIEDTSKLILINTPVLNHQDKADNEAFFLTIPIGIILKESQVVTVTQADNPIMEMIVNDKIKNFNPGDKALFVLHIFEQNVFRYLSCLNQLNKRRNQIEKELYDSSRNSELKQLLRIEKSLVYFVNSISSNDLLMLKMKRTDFLKIRDTDPHEDLFEDIIIDNGQALDMSNVYTNILSGTMEAYASIVSNNLNTFIHRLTVITIILMVPTLVASFYGMNLDYLPFSDSPFAFYVLIFISILLGVSLIFYLGKGSKNL